MNRTLAITAVTALVAGTPTLLAVAPAQAGDGAEKHARGTVAGARFDISAEKERGRFEVDAELDGVAANSRWKMVVRHDGKKVATKKANARRDDGRWEVDFRSVNRKNSGGKDVFKVTLKRTDGAGKVTRKLSFSS